MRIAFFCIMIALASALGFLAKAAFRSPKKIGNAVAHMLCALIPPMIGNAIIVISSSQSLSTIGYYIYFLGMNGVMAALIHFTDQYCGIGKEKKLYKIPGIVLLAIDTIQLLCNIIWGHAFSTVAIEAGGYTYYSLVPLGGQTFHRIVDYGLLAVSIIIFFLKAFNSPKINAERYYVILLTMLVITAWESFYIFSRTPIDRSMIGFGVFGLLVYFFSLKYRPLRLLDSMLSNIASGLPEALFFYDAFDQCIWANQSGIDLVKIENEDYEVATTRLRKMFGEFKTGESKQHEVQVGGEIKSYVVEKHDVVDDKGRITGSFLSVRDNTSEQMTLREEVYKATHDPLTGVYNRAGYNILLGKAQLWKTIMLLIDGDCFKSVNDTYGHEMGDRVLQRMAATIKDNFRSDDYVCRFGGDEFVVMMVHSDTEQKKLIIDRINRINEILNTQDGDIPPVTISAGIAHGRNAKYGEELFEHADRALYETKHNGKNGFTFYEELVSEKK
ncbi:MAG: diguanylate cyclase [Clostridia bacterium]|nr:diguanylate cyclase [Clostridia bacterium]